MIRIDNLSVHFGNAVAVHDLSLSVGDGKSFGLVGESGSGKSTVLRTVMAVDWGHPYCGRRPAQGAAEGHCARYADGVPRPLCLAPSQLHDR